MCGSVSSEYSPYQASGSLNAQKILLAINSQPLSVSEIAVSTSLSRVEVKEALKPLLKCSLVGELSAAGRTKYKPLFAIFTVKDQEKLLPLITELSDVLTGICRESMPLVRERLKQIACVKAGYHFPELEYIAVGAYTLDFNALQILERKGLLISGKEMPGGRYVFTGMEKGLINPADMLMWGHSTRYGRYTFYSHGGLPPNTSRRVFPDVTWLWYPIIEDPNLIERKMVELGDILYRLLKGPIEVDELIIEMKENTDTLTLMLDLLLLEGMGYLSIPEFVDSGKLRYKLGRPILTSKDKEIIWRISEYIIGRFAEKLEQKRQSIEEVYSQATPAKNGISIKEAFNHIYHLAFAKATKTLINRNIMSSPLMMKDGGKYSVWVTVEE